MKCVPSAQELTILYCDKKLSLSEMAYTTNLKIHKILYWMDKYGIKRRHKSEANYLKANPNGEPFKIKSKLTKREIKLKYLALGLYWGEGNKATNHKNRVTNSDPGVIKISKNIYLSCAKYKITKFIITFKHSRITTLAKRGAFGPNSCQSTPTELIPVNPSIRWVMVPTRKSALLE
ncbi:hypothetical protein A3K29_05085 [Candidatus Collierbacteria bacterium RIFOXYB2_FULL_46_14]|uniref:Uncharacterized protein n=1 Tax=Candidatus Collierbacteria bacterium GW2011_GWA2_46_26 TaxID=1618381 RepID=A0A0G1SI75_9BACT|nr:MAG: hypothetical protein UX47_C0006G0016 [Candidatus Collierbacteria bacterium GW2011_GWA2_46_26]OGD73471.1 MAG: hypothetical protein A3K29_05085 [Candidatus Collierbacteria bacterium RIFOXYB2_FULL_46_14]OGD76513.1 MAG: hypothetical protein A3K43_05085 [Candidatus Collierbacteria bacterium RIFOXYA2_FULL_46_20]OGD77849.1 MAG: hypothetical protein A3K39_05085 [Candidatus Collierbacteria bacterium RIFOXYC2_FULL_43_15]OGD81140.1 MAG: hypothetical protein A2320_05585 [Pseudomonadales bacterium G